MNLVLVHANTGAPYEADGDDDFQATTAARAATHAGLRCDARSKETWTNIAHRTDPAQYNYCYATAHGAIRFEACRADCRPDQEDA